MAYFDSPKNRAMWNVELGDLKKMKNDFASGKLTNIQTSSMKRENIKEGRKPITFEQLVKEEQKQSPAKAAKQSMNMEKAANKSRDMSLPTKASVLQKAGPESGKSGR